MADRTEVVVVGGNAGFSAAHALTEVLVTESQDAIRWLHGKGLRHRLVYERRAHPDPQGRQVFRGGLAVGGTGGGTGGGTVFGRRAGSPA